MVWISKEPSCGPGTSAKTERSEPRKIFLQVALFLNTTGARVASDSATSMTPREAELTRQLEQALQVNAALQRENQLLREKVNLLVRRVFGASSEKMDAAQLQLLLSGAELVEPAAEPKAEAPKPKPQVPAAAQAQDPAPARNSAGGRRGDRSGAGQSGSGTVSPDRPGSQ